MFSLATDPSSGRGTGAGPGSGVLYTVVDTGQVNCYNNNGVIGTCNSGSFPGQDGKFINIPRARNLTGPIQSPAFPSDTTTTDNVTGLVWKSCTEGLSGAACASGSVSTMTQGGALAACASLNSMNGSQGYAARTDWRLPTIRELATIINYSVNSPAIDANFPNTPLALYYWTSTVQSGGPNYWAASFDQGILNGFLPSTPSYVRCVAGPALPAQAFVDQGDGTVLDQSSQLVWQKADPGLLNDWKNALLYCTGLALAGRSWRLPNVNEILSLVDFGFTAPAINGSMFPGTSSAGYWSSTTVPALTPNSWVVDFTGGSLLGVDKNATIHYYRCVAGP